MLKVPLILAWLDAAAPPVTPTPILGKDQVNNVPTGTLPFNPSVGEMLKA